MRKVIAGINMTLDGFCNHDSVIADEEIHEHYSEVLRNAGLIMWGRITYQLMEFWPPLVKNPSGDKAMDEFAVVIDNIDKVVYSRTLEGVDWHRTELKREIDRDEILALKEQEGKDILIGSPSLIVQFGNLGLIDEYQLVIHPVVLGKGLPLFKNVEERIDLKLLRTKTFGCGAVLHCYAPQRGAS